MDGAAGAGRSASPTTHLGRVRWRAWVAFSRAWARSGWLTAVGVMGAMAVLGGGGCATAPRARGPVDVVVPATAGRSRIPPGPLRARPGQLLVLDICASWAVPCAGNARVMHDTRQLLLEEGDRLVFVTLLLDDESLLRAAAETHLELFGPGVMVLGAGPALRAGETVVGPVGAVPRLVVLDAEGRILLDEQEAYTAFASRRLAEALRALLAAQ